MILSLILNICGLPLLIVMGILSVGLTITACYLTFAVKRENLLSAFFPLNLLPIAAGLVSTLFEVLIAVDSQLDLQTETVAESGFLLLMSLVPLLTGCAASIPSGLIVVVGRWMLAWKSSGLRLIPEKEEEPGEEISAEEMIRRDTNDYLERLVRPR